VRLIEVTIDEGRSAAAIRSMIHEVREVSAAGSLGTAPDLTRVIVREMPRAHWATGDVT
jgi:4-oxalocrotonate tautomerase